MTSQDCERSRLLRDAALEHDEQLLALLHQTYRQLEATYRRSPAYGAMVARYPQLARAIAHCRQSDLVGDRPVPRPSRPTLQWERSHGDP